MKKYLSIVFSLLCISLQAQSGIYSTAYGNHANPAVIFMHGGPGYNAGNFEFSTAEELASKGYYVIVYDQRGSGRSKNYAPNGDFSFKEQIKDAEALYKKYGIKKATIIGHSWGGTLATKFALAKPKLVSRIVFVGSPISYQMTFKNIITRCQKIYSERGDSSSLSYMNIIETQMDSTSLEYSSYCFMHAQWCGLYATKSPTISYSKFWNKVNNSTDKVSLLRQMDYEPVKGVYYKEKYTLLNLAADWAKLKKKGVKLFGIYGDEDGLFDTAQLDLITKALGVDNMLVVKGASHNVFIDKMDEFTDRFIYYQKQ
jgi:proline iminopeptidase